LDPPLFEFSQEHDNSVAPGGAEEIGVLDRR
jgi:hypothetical protein